jgi:hypothetical protein
MEKINLEFSDIAIPQVEFMAKYDPTNGQILAVGPSIAFFEEKFKLPIDEDIAIQIIQGMMLLSSCKVNIIENQVEISEEKSLFKIDDVLHRVIDKKFFDLDRIDVKIKFNKKSQKFTFFLADDLGGTLKNPKKDKDKKRKVTWSGETLMNFYITDYNDPNILYSKLEFTISDLEKKNLTVKILTELPEEFSIYTRRLFKNYVVEK